jgi:hypothetical protein
MARARKLANSRQREFRTSRAPGAAFGSPAKWHRKRKEGRGRAVQADPIKPTLKLESAWN